MGSRLRTWPTRWLQEALALSLASVFVAKTAGMFSVLALGNDAHGPLRSEPLVIAPAAKPTDHGLGFAAIAFAIPHRLLAGLVLVLIVVALAAYPLNVKRAAVVAMVGMDIPSRSAASARAWPHESSGLHCVVNIRPSLLLRREMVDPTTPGTTECPGLAKSLLGGLSVYAFAACGAVNPRAGRLDHLGIVRALSGPRNDSVTA